MLLEGVERVVLMLYLIYSAHVLHAKQIMNCLTIHHPRSQRRLLAC
jgi:hypothetical protein